MEGGKIEINGISCNYSVLGGGEDILILHGWGANLDVWKETQKELVKNGFRVFLLDLPGFGKTEQPNSVWNLNDYKDFVIEFIKKNNLDNFYLIGHSFGGRISIKLASETNLKIKKLVLVSPAGIKINLDLKTRIILFFVNTFNIIFKIFPSLFFKNIFKKIVYFILRKRDYVKTSSNMREIMKEVIKEDLKPLLKNIKINTLLIWGENDKMIPLKYGHIFNKEIKNSSLSIIKNSGHSPNKDNFLKLSEQIIKFL